MHKKLNQAHRPCHQSPSYNYGQCLHKAAMIKAGCQPHWRLYSVEGLPICDNVSMVNTYQDVMGSMQLNMDSDELYQETDCLMPCTYLEYKVKLIFSITNTN